MVFFQINPNMSLATTFGVLAMIVSMTVFTLFNHLIVGMMVWMAWGESFRGSGVFDNLPIIISLTLLSLGG
jgi:hypothetical protein